MSTTPDTLANASRTVVALLDSGMLVLNVTDDMDDTDLAENVSTVDGFLAAVALETAE